MDAWLGYEDLKTLEASISATKAQTTKNFSSNTNTTFLKFSLILASAPTKIYCHSNT